MRTKLHHHGLLMKIFYAYLLSNSFIFKSSSFTKLSELLQVLKSINTSFCITCVCIEVVSQQCDCSECPSTQVTFMRSLVCMALHVSVQVGAPWTGVATQLTLESLLYTWTQKGHIISSFQARQIFFTIKIVKRNLT